MIFSGPERTSKRTIALLIRFASERRLSLGDKMYTVLRYEPGLCYYFDAFVVEQSRRIIQTLSVPSEMLQGRPPMPFERHGRSVTPEETLSTALRDAGVDDARQAEYQRKMSMLLGRGSG